MRISPASIGGNTPQRLVNHFATELAAGRHHVVLIAGVKLLATLSAALGNGDDSSRWRGAKMDSPRPILEDAVFEQL